MEQTYIPETLERLAAAVEALLFASPEPLSDGELARLTGWEPRQVAAAVAMLERRLAEDPTRGLCLVRVNNGSQLATRPDFAPLLARLREPRPPAPLSRAALETLAIIAYKQPVTRAEIDHLRGVRSESALQSLQDRELIEEAGRADGPGRPILYRTTEKFLHWCGLNSLDDLPPLPEPETPAGAEDPHTSPAAGSD